MADTPTDAVEHARASMDALQDPVSVEYEAVLSWLRQRPALRDGVHRWVLVRDMLSPGWRDKALSFGSLNAATVFVRRLAVNHAAKLLLADTYGACVPAVGSAGQDAVIAGIAQQLFDGRLLVLDARAPHWSAGKTDPAVYQALNTQYGTRVDFAYLGQWEGGQYLHGYVPISSKADKVQGKSGLTIATGFDIGQKSKDEITALNLPADLTTRLQPYANVRFTDMSRAQVLQKIKLLGAVPVVSKDEADAIDKVVHGQHLSAAVASWNARRAKDVPAFKDLPGPWQTVLFSRTFHQGVGMPNSKVAKTFYTNAVTGKWKEAVDALRAYPVAEDWYKARVGKEADYLKSQMPPDLPSDSTPGKPAIPGMPSIPVPGQKLP